MTVVLAALNQFFFFRYPSVSISGYVAVLISLPIGRAWAAVRFKPASWSCAYLSLCK